LNNDLHITSTSQSTHQDSVKKNILPAAHSFHKKNLPAAHFFAQKNIFWGHFDFSILFGLPIHWY